MKKQTIKEAGRTADFLNTVAMAKREYKPGQKVSLKGREGQQFVFHKYDDDGSAIVGSNGKKYRVHPLNIKEISEAVKKTAAAAKNTKGVPEVPSEISEKPCSVKIMGVNEEEHIQEKSKGDEYEYDYEGDMAMSQLKSIMTNAKLLHDMMEPNTNLPEWVQSKITLAKDYIETARDYMQTQMNEEFVVEAEGNFPPARLIGAGMKAAKKKHGIDSGMPYKELKSKHPEVAKTGWRIAHVFWRKEKAAAKKNSKVKKESIEEGRALTFQQRLARGRQMRRIEPKVYRGQLRYQDRVPSESRLQNRAERMARNVIKMKISHTPYDQMSIPEKIMVDKILERKQQAIKRLAQRLLPKVRKMSIQRISGAGTLPSQKMPRLREETNTIPYLSESVETIYALASGEENKAVKALKEKAEKAGVPFETIVEVYSEAIQEYTPRKISSEQYAFNAVNSFVSNKINEDFKQMSINQMFGEMAEGISDYLRANKQKRDAEAARFAKPSEGESVMDKTVQDVGELGKRQRAKLVAARALEDQKVAAKSQP